MLAAGVQTSSAGSRHMQTGSAGRYIVLCLGLCSWCYTGSSDVLCWVVRGCAVGEEPVPGTYWAIIYGTCLGYVYLLRVWARPLCGLFHLEPPCFEGVPEMAPRLGPFWPHFGALCPILPYFARARHLLGHSGSCLFGVGLPTMGLGEPPVWCVAPGTTLFRRGS